ncbi:MAG: tRNA 2-thiouridine(34) synthase MnmA [Actinobacteria bacterium]|nr:tRNA 2-thiouridine(34) synthase MnmA [Actinomycetota bacterium]
MKETSSKKIGLAFSGGLDSTAAGIILKNEGHEIIAVTMSIETDENEIIIERASRIARKAGFVHKIIDLNAEFKREVISPFIKAYESGMTPNPCIRCNRDIKFGALMRKTLDFGCDLFATGHYVRLLGNSSKKQCLKRGIDSRKDQSYMLWTLGQAVLGNSIFPLGNTTKENIRRLVRETGIEDNAPESQDICFLAGRSYRSLFDGRAEGTNTGPVYTVDGTVIGKHKGLTYYTIGQRKGLDLGTHEAMFVVKIDPEDNSITVGGREDLKCVGFTVSELNFIEGLPPARSFKCEVETRYRGPLACADVKLINSSEGIVSYSEPGFRGAPGQSAVFYRGDTLLGGGVINREQ